MALLDELNSKVDEYVTTRWETPPKASVVPTAENLTLGNTGKVLDACVLYADIHRSTEMVDDLIPELAAEYYKAFLYCSARIIKSNNGEITAYDGDRVMAVFIGEDQADRAVISAMQINYAVMFIINPKFQTTYTNSHKPLKHTVGIDCGEMLVSKVGVRVDSDLVWVGSASNYAAKLNSFETLKIEYSTRITQEVFNKLSNRTLFGGDKQMMWDGTHDALGKKLHYRSRYYMPVT